MKIESMVRCASFLVLQATLIASPLFGQTEGWRVVDPATPVPPPVRVTGKATAQPINAKKAQGISQPSGGATMMLMSGGASYPDADAITPDIESLARGIIASSGTIPNWEKCFRYVASLDYEHYYGCKRGAQLTMLEKAGNDADLSTLLVALLRSAGYQARYGKAVLMMDAGGSGYTMQSWLGVGPDSINYFSVNRAFPTTYTDPAFPGKQGLDRIWVEVLDGQTWRKLDPAVKQRVVTPIPFDVFAASGYNREAMKTAAGGTLTGDYSLDGLSTANLATYLQARANALVSYIETNHATTENIVGKTSYTPMLENGAPKLFFGELFNTYTTSDAIPDSLLVKLTLTVLRYDNNAQLTTPIIVPTASLQGRRISFDFTTTGTTGKARIWLEDDIIAQETTTAVLPAVKLSIQVQHPWALISQTEARVYKRGERYVITYGFRPSADLLRKRREKLDQYLQSGLAATSREVVSECLYLIGLSWLYQSDSATQIIARMSGQDFMMHHHFGRVGQEAGFYVDLGLNFTGLLPGEGFESTFDAYCMFASAMEHAAVEQARDDGKQGMSTVKAWQQGTTQVAGSRAMFYASTANWIGGANIKSQLKSYGSSELASIDSTIASGGTVLLPQKGNIKLNSWTGTGFMLRSGLSRGMIISGGLSGGYSTVTGNVDPVIFTTTSNYSPIQINPTPITIASPLGRDPIDMVTGDYVYEATDLSIGSGEAPRGIAFVRNYHGNRRRVDSARLGNGWTHNWQVVGAARTAYEAALGIGGTPMDTATMLLAARATYDLCQATPNVQHLTLAGLVATWGIDQMRDNAFAVSIGNRSLQFIKRPDGSWQSPPGVTSTFSTNGTGWKLQERHGNTYNFNSDKELATIVDPWGKTMTITWNASHRPTKVTDAYGGYINFTYASNRLTKITDHTARTVLFGQSAADDLENITDPEGKKDYFSYDADHRVTAIRNHDLQVIATNVYDDSGRVKEQLSQGLAARTWKYYFGEDFSIEEDPLGGRKTWFYDKRKRTIGIRDELGRHTSIEYDGQDRKKREVSPLGLTQEWTYDRFHNLLTSKDQDNHVTTRVYDTQHRLQKIVDPLNHETTFTYNTTHQPLTITNPLGQTIQNVYNPTGTLTAHKQPGGNFTTYVYVTRDLPYAIQPPDAQQTIFMRNDLGDVTAEVNAGNSYTYTYNKRRQILTENRPDGGVTTTAYDNQRNIASISAPNNIRNFTYSPTGKILTAVWTGYGTTTYAYDAADRCTSETDPFARVVTYLYNAAGELTGEKDPLNRLTSFGYDIDGRQTTITNPLGHVVTTSYNGRGMPAGTLDGLNRTTANTYDAAGRRTLLTNRRSEEFDFAYDNADRLLSTVTPLNRTYSQTINSRGWVATASKPSGQSSTFTYNDYGRVTTRSDAVGTTSFTYNGERNLVTVAQSGLGNISRGYTAIKRQVANYMDGQGQAFFYEWNTAGRLTKLTYEASNKFVTYNYDTMNRLTSLRDWTGRTVSFTYTHNRLTQITRPNGVSRAQEWDAAGQLTAVTERHTGGNPVGILRMNYDSAGRLTRKLELPSQPPATPPPAVAATYNADNQLTNFAGMTIPRDADGNILEAPSVIGAGTQTYSWNARGALTAAAGVTHVYNAEGHRISSTSGGQTVTWTVDPHGGSMSRTLIRTKPGGAKTYYIYAGDTLLYQIDGTTGEARYYHYDHLGSTIAITNDSGAVTDTVTYSAHGQTLSRTGTTDTPFLWMGGFGVQTDANGLLHMRARYYHPKLARFLSEDPIQFGGGLNWYAYAEGNPAMYIDPLGLTSLYLYTEHMLRADDDPTFFPRVAEAMASVNRTHVSATGGYVIPGEDPAEQIIAPFSRFSQLSRETKNITSITIVGHPVDYQPVNFDLGSVSRANIAVDATIYLYGCTAGSGSNNSGTRFANYFQRTTLAPPGGVSFGFKNDHLYYARTPYQESENILKALMPVKMNTFRPTK